VVDTIKEQREASANEPLIPRRLDGLEQALLQGKVVDQNFKPIVADKNMATQPSPHLLDSDEQRGHKGELRAGEVGWVELDVNGKPVGAATKFPKKDVPQAPVSTIVEATPSVLATPAGAFLTDGGMNPSPAAYKYASSAYGRDYIPFAKRSMEKWGLSMEGAAAPVPPRPTGKAA
jgi:hypothetical protein